MIPNNSNQKSRKTLVFIVFWAPQNGAQRISQNDGKDEDNETLSYTEMQKLDEMIEQARYYAMIAEDFMMMMEDRKQEQENNK